MTDNLPACIIDIGTATTKLGFAGDKCVTAAIPTAIAKDERGASTGYLIGNNALSAKQSFVQYPLHMGNVRDWQQLEYFLQESITALLNIDPKDRAFLLTSAKLHTIENRKKAAEIMFEKFGVPALHIALQGPLALYASWISKPTEQHYQTGLIVESGEGATHVIAVVKGSSWMKEFPIAGHSIDAFIQQLVHEREENVPTEAAKKLKEMYCYCCPNIVKEFAKYDRDPQQWICDFTDINKVCNQPFSIDVGHERFLGPELYFQPELFQPGCKASIAKMIDQTIKCFPPGDRIDLYKNIVLSGGSTIFKDFGRRLEREVKEIGNLSSVEVNVCSHHMQRYGVFYGGSMLAATPEFVELLQTKQDYEEKGTRKHTYGESKVKTLIKDWPPSKPI